MRKMLLLASFSLILWYCASATGAKARWSSDEGALSVSSSGDSGGESGDDSDSSESSWGAVVMAAAFKYVPLGVFVSCDCPRESLVSLVSGPRGVESEWKDMIADNFASARSSVMAPPPPSCRGMALAYRLYMN